MVFSQVSSSDVSIVEVLNAERDSQSEHVIHFPVRLRDRAALWELDKIDVEIEIKCVATTQKKIIPVRVKLIGQRQDLGEWFDRQSNKWFLIEMLESTHVLVRRCTL